MTKIQSGMFPGATEMGTRPIRVYRLPQLIDAASIQSNSLLKIDVQGFELNVLQGCEDILHKFSNLYIECSFFELYEGQALAHQVIAWLEKKSLC